jgi:hypothetical protein
MTQAKILVPQSTLKSYLTWQQPKTSWVEGVCNVYDWLLTELLLPEPVSLPQ